MISKTLTLAAAAALSLALVAGCSSKSDEAQAGKPPASAAAQKIDQAGQGAAVGQAAPEFTLTSADGNTVSLVDFRGSHVVLEWVNYDCPFVKAQYASQSIQTMQKALREKGVVWLSICSSAPGKQGHVEGTALTERIKSEGSNATAYLVDSDGTVGRMYGAKTTPHMFVVSPDGMIVYAGAIDDNATTDAAAIPNSNNYVKAALDASMSGSALAISSTAPYGCGVKY